MYNFSVICQLFSLVFASSRQSMPFRQKSHFQSFVQFPNKAQITANCNIKFLDLLSKLPTSFLLEQSMTPGVAFFARDQVPGLSRKASAKAGSTEEKLPTFRRTRSETCTKNLNSRLRRHVQKVRSEPQRQGPSNVHAPSSRRPALKRSSRFQATLPSTFGTRLLLPWTHVYS